MITKRILCYGDSNTWGWVPLGMGLKRHSQNERWPKILQKLLGKNYEIIENGLGGRTTMFDDPRPEFPNRNGLNTLPIILESQLPLDLIIVMLGTTDTKEMLKVSSKKTTEGLKKIITCIKSFKIINKQPSPKILIIVPPVIDENTDFAKPLFKGATKKSKDLVKLYAKLAKEEQIFYLNPTSTIKVDKQDGIHIDNKMHNKLAKLIFQKIKIEQI
jgi:lysophospholipase L1-like esterase